MKNNPRNFTLTLGIDFLTLTDDTLIQDVVYIRDIELIDKSLYCRVYCDNPWTIELGWYDLLNRGLIILKEHDINKHVLYVNPFTNELEVGNIDLKGVPYLFPTKTYVTTDIIYKEEY